MKIRWLRRPPAAAPKTFRERLGRMGRLVYCHVVRVDASPAQVGAGVAVGVALGVLPTFGLGIPLAYFIALVFHVNKAAAIAGSLISNPLTSPLIWAASAFVGAIVVGEDWRVLTEQLRAQRYLLALTHASGVYMVGNGLLTGVTAAAGYVAAYVGVKERMKRRAAHRRREANLV